MKKAQITIFMILGIILLLVFLLTFKLVSEVNKSSLSAEDEQVLNKVFEGEGLKSYMESCLQDSLVNGILLYGKQGRIWADEGGKEEFISGYNGIEFGNNNLAYLISRSRYQEGEDNVYPCIIPNQEGAGYFCDYHYPDLSVNFGDKSFSLPTTELKLFMLQESKRCVQDYLESEIFSVAELEEEEPEISIKILDDGIRLNVNYPLRLKLGEEEFYQLNKFDIFYPTPLKRFLETAVFKPLSWDRSFADFDFSAETMEKDKFYFASPEKYFGCENKEDYFSCPRDIPLEEYNYFAVQFKKTDFNGDDIFELKPELKMGEGMDNFILRFVRQNRPPALDKIYSCSGGLIQAEAIDPDEDEVTYIFEINNEKIEENNDGRLDLNEVSFTSSYTLRVTASDGHLGDWQDLNVKSRGDCS